MDVQLKELIEKIKNDGVKSAEESAEKIIGDAEKKGQEILNKARKEADEIKAVAEAEAFKTDQSGKEALHHAGRDLILDLKSELQRLFDSLILKEVSGSMKESAFTDVLVTVLNNWKVDQDGDIDVFVSEEQFSDLEKVLKEKLSKAVSAGIELKPYKEINTGFRISRKDGSAFFDFSDEEMTGVLSRYLNPRLSYIIKD